MIERLPIEGCCSFTRTHHALRVDSPKACAFCRLAPESASQGFHPRSSVDLDILALKVYRFGWSVIKGDGYVNALDAP